MYFRDSEWSKIPILLEELKGLLSELSDQELEHLKKLAIDEEKKASDRRLSNENNSTG